MATEPRHSSRLPLRALCWRVVAAMLAVALAASPAGGAAAKTKRSPKSSSKSSTKSSSKRSSKTSGSKRASSKTAPKKSPPKSSPKPKPKARSGEIDTIEDWEDSIRDAESRYDESWSASVRDLETGRVILDYSSSRKLVPASTRKIMVFALAMDAFGPDYKFKTQLGLTKNAGVSNGAVTANVVLRSAGDPTMDERFLSQKNPATVLRGWIGELARKGVRRINGDFIIDASAFGAEQDRHPSAWNDDHIGQSYATYPSAIALNRNLLQVTVNPTSSGKGGKISIYPSIEGLNIVNGTRTVSGRSTGLSAKFGEDGKTLTISGNIGRSIGAHGAHLPHVRPLEFVRAIVQDELNTRGILLGGKVKIVTDPAEGERHKIAEVLGQHESPKLSELTEIMLTNSDNFIADQLWRAVAFRSKKKGDPAAARQWEKEWLSARKLGWIEPGHDGSGLSRENSISAAEQVAILAVVYRSPQRDLFLEGLPSAGESGTLRGRSFGERGRVVAKTGTLNGVGALAGFIRDAQGKERWAFSLLGNAPGATRGRINTRANQIMDILLKLLDSGQLSGNSGPKLAPNAWASAALPAFWRGRGPVGAGGESPARGAS